jgi:hypothetical protein
VQPLPFSRRSLFIAAVSVLVAVVVALVVLPSRSGSPEPQNPPTSLGSPTSLAPLPSAVPPPELARRACGVVGGRVLQRVYNGTHPTRSGNIQMVPKEPNFIDGGLTHASPFKLTQHIPLLLYGPSYVQPGVYDQRVSLADLPATTADLLKFHRFKAPNGRALREGLLPPDERPTPKLIVTLIWDSAGMDLLNRWPDDWPTLAAMREDGAWFSKAEVGSSPSNTPPSHATIGTGAFPRQHGMIDEYAMIDGELVKPNSQGPSLMLLPTLADVYDLARNNQPVVGGLGSLSAHVMMMSHGQEYDGGDADIAVTREVEYAKTGGDDAAEDWLLTGSMAPYYYFPTYANDPEIEAVFEQAKDDLDQLDGKLDGLWRDESIETRRGGFNTPARTPYQTELIEQVVMREGFGRDNIPDLLYLNYKMIDTLGHQFSADGVEMSDALSIQDQSLATFVDFLNEQVGEGEWVMLLTADHGMQRDPVVSGAFPIDIDDLESVVNERFSAPNGRKVLLDARPTQMWLDEDVLATRGATLEDVSAFLMSLTQADTTGAVNPKAGHEDDLVFDAVFPSTVMDQMPCIEQDVSR